MEILVATGLNPTESRERVSKAIGNIFPSLGFKEKKSKEQCTLLEGSGNDKKDMAALKELLKQQHIRTSARAFMFDKAEENLLSFGLSKQAAYTGKISFVDFDVALGPIWVELKEESPEKLELLIEWLCG